ncbi:hypothetical protein [Saprospira grandis]|uniref:Uncharacterized protein n=1 Tax=Saprospira grandis (strain Lewin) TaxID=984262 RepID=H6L8R7_SAPGL|nr:hypothetical protein [Saprospira grandis]AFC26873.1 hypothetical protein SGRA_4158 [Saprospira grandis str. Lewin]
MSVRIYLLSVFSFLIFMGNLQAQEEYDQFRIDCNYMNVYSPIEESWGGWEESSNTFILNHGPNNDIAQYKLDGSRRILRRISGVEEGETEDGLKYQLMTVVDEEGSIIAFQIFNEKRFGVRLIWTDIDLIILLKP